MDDWCAGTDGFLDIENSRQGLVGHVDEANGGLGNSQRVGGHRSHAVADIAHLVIEADLVVGRRIRVRLAAGRVLNALDVTAMDDGAHAGQRPRLAVVDGNDARVGVRTGQQLGIEHAPHFDVVNEGRIALGQLDGIDLGFRLADDLHLRAGAGLQQQGGRAGMGLCCRPEQPATRPLWRLRQGQVVVAFPVDGDGGDQVARIDDGGIDVRRRLLAAQNGRGAQDGQHRSQIARLATEHARQRVAHLRFGGVGVVVKQRLGGQDHRRCRVAGLDGPRLDERQLDGMEFADAGRETFDGLDGVADRLAGQERIGADQTAVEQDGRCARLASVAAEADADIASRAQGIT